MYCTLEGVFYDKRYLYFIGILMGRERESKTLGLAKV